jgi:hypothetical protein
MKYGITVGDISVLGSRPAVDAASAARSRRRRGPYLSRLCGTVVSTMRPPVHTPALLGDWLRKTDFLISRAILFSAMSLKPATNR